MKRLLLLVFLSGCAASSMPTQYAQGMPTAPRAPAFNPTLDAPITVGQPGYVGPAENYPRAPQKRVLPETPVTRREPGIWAASTQEPGLPLLLGFPPVDEMQAAHEPEYVESARSCAAMMDRAITMAEERQRVNELPADQRRCLAARLFQTCIEDAARRGRTVPERAMRLATKRGEDECRGVDERFVQMIRRNALSEYGKRIDELGEKMKRLR